MASCVTRRSAGFLFSLRACEMAHGAFASIQKTRYLLNELDESLKQNAFNRYHINATCQDEKLIVDYDFVLYDRM